MEQEKIFIGHGIRDKASRLYLLPTPSDTKVFSELTQLDVTKLWNRRLAHVTEKYL